MATSPTPILFMSSAEHGQVNVVLAIAQAISQHPEFAIHIAANGPLRGRVEQLNKLLPSPITYHCVPGLSMQEVSARQYGGTDISGNSHTPGFLGAIRSFSTLEPAVLGWEPDEYMEGFEACRDIIRRVKPAAIVCDMGFWQGHDAARALGLKYISVAPSSAKEIAGGEMPGAPIFSKWPAMGTGFRYPLSMIDVAKNIIVMIAFVVSILRGRYYNGIVKVRKSRGLKHNFPMLGMYDKAGLYICPYLPATDWDSGFRDIPSNVIGCGPITLPSVSIEDVDKELWNWLGKNATILINLGSHFSMDAKAALEMAKGIKAVLESRPDLQCLWKLKYDWKCDAELEKAVCTLIDSDRLRMVSWLNVDPCSLLESGRIACSVHHGGANSYYESCKLSRAGVPQLVLPVCWDTYEFAERVRYLGLGAIGNVGVAPGVESSRFSASLLEVLGDEQIRVNAKRVATACKDRGEGRELATKEVMDWARQKKTNLRETEEN